MLLIKSQLRSMTALRVLRTVQPNLRKIIATSDLRSGQSLRMLQVCLYLTPSCCSMSQGSYIDKSAYSKVPAFGGSIVSKVLWLHQTCLGIAVNVCVTTASFLDLYGGHIELRCSICDAEPAEQKVLGQLEGAEDWAEVMDMASREVYFWNGITNEVVWDAPAGSMPR